MRETGTEAIRFTLLPWRLPQKARLVGKYRWREFPAVITVLGNTPNFGKVGNTGKYEIIGLFWLRYSA